MKILFVDDDRFIINAISRNLRDSSWQIDYALSGPEALVKLEEGGYDVIVTDMAMPAMKGDRLLREVRELDPGITRIILSGHADQSLQIDDAKLAHRWLDKPCDPAYLVEVLSEVERERRLS
jgi:CheY-like chemotaxis protein